jgi:hypothetical protein
MKAKKHKPQDLTPYATVIEAITEQVKTLAALKNGALYLVQWLIPMTFSF